jgi:hypothetical protein
MTGLVLGCDRKLKDNAPRDFVERSADLAAWVGGRDGTAGVEASRTPRTRGMPPR